MGFIFTFGPMKYFAFILSMFFMSLALFPCQDNEDMALSVIHVSIQKSHSGDNHADQESCPPFCSCSCCSTARQLTSMITMTVFSQTVTHLYPDYAISAIQEQAIKIWQPPQIA
jgi:hypothetical protein